MPHTATKRSLICWNLVARPILMTTMKTSMQVQQKVVPIVKHCSINTKKISGIAYTNLLTSANSPRGRLYGNTEKICGFWPVINVSNKSASVALQIGVFIRLNVA
jgi:hypothetical protein